MSWLVVGLGNPGPEYANTPHNIGFDVLDRLADRHRITLVGKHEGRWGVGRLGRDARHDTALLEPLTYMNLSGRSVKPALKTLGLDPAQLLVVHDEIDLEFGRLQLKFGGGLAGHNGLKSIAELLGTRDFARLRVGVGRPEPGDRRPIRDWILSSWQHPTSVVDDLVDEAARVVEDVVTTSLRGAMKRSNTAPRRPAPRPHHGDSRS